MEVTINEGGGAAAHDVTEKTCLVKTWDSECGVVTITTCKWVTETHAEFVARHRKKIKEMEELCPPLEEGDDERRP
jgi:hypothetical protein